MKGRTSVLLVLILISPLVTHTQSNLEDKVLILNSPNQATSKVNAVIVNSFNTSYGSPLIGVDLDITWDDYVNTRDGTGFPEVLDFKQRSDGTYLLLTSPNHVGQLLNNLTYGMGDSVLLNIDQNGHFLRAQVIDNVKATDNRERGMTVIVESPNGSDLILLGTMPQNPIAYSIMNGAITIPTRSNLGKDAFVAISLNSTTFDYSNHLLVSNPVQIGTQNGGSCRIALYEETYENDTEFGFFLELSDSQQNAGGATRCYSYTFGDHTIYGPSGGGSGATTNYLLRANYSLDFISGEAISSEFGAVGSTAQFNTPPVFLSDGGWARVNYNDYNSPNTLVYSNRNGSISGSISACDKVDQLELVSDNSGGFYHLCQRSDVINGVTIWNNSLLHYNLSNQMAYEIDIGVGSISSLGYLIPAPNRMLMSLSSTTTGLLVNNTNSYFGQFTLEINLTSHSIYTAHDSLKHELKSSTAQENFPSFSRSRVHYHQSSSLMILPGGAGTLDQFLILEIDSDSDGVPDRTDLFPSEPSQSTDVDNDGYGDNPLGVNGDDCKYQNGNSSVDLNGCPDNDGDGYSNQGDIFQNDQTQQADFDSDGYGDNSSGLFGDACPSTYGESTRDRYGCTDSDFDGWSDDYDRFPQDSSQWNDSDDDGYGDEFNGFQGDACPSIVGNSTEDRFGCADFDSDGWSDDGDDLPSEPSQWKDRDGDGYGENTVGVNPDSFPADGTQWNDSDGDGHGDNPYGTEGDWFPDDATRWQDSDRDGIADEDDAFPNEVTQWRDTDGDGYGDEETGNRADAFPNDVNEWADSDMDGLGNNADAFPFDPTQTEDRDGDGMGDNPMGIGADKFPDDATQWGDIDGDGYGDNPLGNNPDIFITDATQWSDADGDGYGDNPTGRLYDQFPQNPTQWVDDDGDGLGDNLDGTDADPYLNDFDNDGYNDSIDILPKLPSPGDLDADGCLDENDVFPSNPQECLDNDGDGEGDNADVDDDNDGWADTDEIRLGTDPFNSAEEPVESFEIVIPGTSVGLGAWDLIGMFGGIPLFVWIGFGFVTRNTRCAKYEAMLREANTRDELESVAYKWEYSLMLRMLGPHQGIRLERLRAELDDKFEAMAQPLSSIDNHQFDQTQMVVEEMNDTEKQVPELVTQSDYPSIEDTAQKTDENGYEWFTAQDGTNFYRTIGSQADWIKLEN